MKLGYHRENVGKYGEKRKIKKKVKKKKCEKSRKYEKYA
jgi:hypothetical protein